MEQKKTQEADAVGMSAVFDPVDWERRLADARKRREAALSNRTERERQKPARDSDNTVRLEQAARGGDEAEPEKTSKARPAPRSAESATAHTPTAAPHRGQIAPPEAPRPGRDASVPQPAKLSDISERRGEAMKPMHRFAAHDGPVVAARPSSARGGRRVLWALFLFGFVSGLGLAYWIYQRTASPDETALSAKMVPPSDATTPGAQTPETGAGADETGEQPGEADGQAAAATAPDRGASTAPQDAAPVIADDDLPPPVAARPPAPDSAAKTAPASSSEPPFVAAALDEAPRTAQTPPPADSAPEDAATGDEAGPTTALAEEDLQATHVRVHVPNGGGEAEARAVLAALDAAGFATEGPIPAPFNVGASNARFFHEGDAERAAAIVEALAGQTDAQTPVTRDFTHLATKPAEGTIELWLSGAATGGRASPQPQDATRRTAPINSQRLRALVQSARTRPAGGQ